MNDNIDIILNTINTLILQEEDTIYFICKGGFSSNAKIEKLTCSWYEPSLEDLDNKLKETLKNQGLTQEEIEEEIEEFHKTDFYKKAVEYFEED